MGVMWTSWGHGDSDGDMGTWGRGHLNANGVGTAVVTVTQHRDRRRLLRGATCVSPSPPPAPAPTTSEGPRAVRGHRGGQRGPGGGGRAETGCTTSLAHARAVHSAVHLCTLHRAQCAMRLAHPELSDRTHTDLCSLTHTACTPAWPLAHSHTCTHTHTAQMLYTQSAHMHSSHTLHTHSHSCRTGRTHLYAQQHQLLAHLHIYTHTSMLPHLQRHTRGTLTLCTCTSATFCTIILTPVSLHTHTSTLLIHRCLYTCINPCTLPHTDALPTLHTHSVHT